MKNSMPEPGVVRQYLLGRLDEQGEQESALSEQILFNDDLAELVELVEDEIIDEYLDGVLDPTDRKDVEGYFLRPPERKEKLRFARILRGYLNTRPHLTVNQAVIPWGTRLRPYWSAAALILLAIISATYIFRIRQKEASLEAQLAEERAHVVAPASRIPQDELAVAVLTLTEGNTRGSGNRIEHIEITHSTRRLLVEISLPGDASIPYDVRLGSNESNETNGIIWSTRLLPLVSHDGARLLFDLPDKQLKSGSYFFAVSSGDDPGTQPKYYDFEMRVSK